MNEWFIMFLKVSWAVEQTRDLCVFPTLLVYFSILRRSLSLIMFFPVTLDQDSNPQTWDLELTVIPLRCQSRFCIILKTFFFAKIFRFEFLIWVTGIWETK